MPLLLVLILVLIAFGLLLVGFLSQSVAWAWVSVLVSAAAAVVLIVDTLQRRSAVRAGDEAAGASRERDGAASAVGQPPASQPVARSAAGQGGTLTAARPAGFEPPTAVASSAGDATSVVPAAPPRRPGFADPATEIIPVVRPGGPGPAGPVSDAERTVVMPVVQPSGSPSAPSGAPGGTTPSKEDSSPRVTKTGSVETVDPPSGVPAEDAVRGPSEPPVGPARAEGDATRAVGLGAVVPVPPAGPERVDIVKPGPPATDGPPADAGAAASPGAVAAPGATPPVADSTANTPDTTDGRPGGIAAGPPFTGPAAADQAGADVPAGPAGGADAPAANGSGGPHDPGGPPAGAATPDAAIGAPVRAAGPEPVGDPPSGTGSSGTLVGAPPAVSDAGDPGPGRPDERDEVAGTDPAGTTPPDEAAAPAEGPGPVAGGEPPEEPRDAAAAALVAGLPDEVLVIDEQPRYHVPGCRSLLAAALIPLPVQEAVELGFSPCGWCTPDRTLAERHAPARS